MDNTATTTSVLFGYEIENISGFHVDWAEFAKRLDTFTFNRNNEPSSLFHLAARAIPNQHLDGLQTLPDDIKIAASKERGIIEYYDKQYLDSFEAKFEWSQLSTNSHLKYSIYQKKEYNKILRDFDFEKAGEKVLTQILGTGHTLGFKFIIYGRGDLNIGDKNDKIFLVHLPSKIEDQESNIPMSSMPSYSKIGTTSCLIPKNLGEKHDAIIESMKQAMDVLGLKADTVEPSWQMLTVTKQSL